MWEMHVINSGGKQQGQQLQPQQPGQGATTQTAGDAGALSECSEAPSSAHSSHGSLSPPTQPPVSPPHPALRDITPPGKQTINLSKHLFSCFTLTSKNLNKLTIFLFYYVRPSLSLFFVFL